MSRRLLTWEQRALRRLARAHGRAVVIALHNARFPVYDEDEIFWLDVAVRHARAAWRKALQATEKTP
jgi:hypothetical protein